MSSLVHSALDFSAAIGSFIAVRYGAVRPDERYRFGRGKAEGFAAIFQVCLIILAAWHLLSEAIHSAEHTHEIVHGGPAIAVMVLATALTLWLIIAQGWAVRSTGSLAVRGDRAHYIADMSGNLLVLLGLVLAVYTPFHHADALAAILISLWLFYTAFKVARLAWNQLMDMELPDAERELIRSLALEDEAVAKVHHMRTRASGPHVHIQMQLGLPSDLSLSEAHDVIIAAEARIMSAYPAADILIHMHPDGCTHMHGNELFSVPE